MRRALLEMIVGLTAFTSPLAAQATSGVGSDAIPVPEGGTRISIGGFWSSYGKRLAPSPDGGAVRSPLFSGFARNSLTAADFPVLTPAQDAIRSLTGEPKFTLTLGALEARGDVSQSVVPLHVEYGIRKYLSIGLLVPYVETRSDSRFVLNRGGKGATVGENPARTTATAATARATNGALLQQIDAARAALAAEVTRCSDAAATGGGCAAIRTNPAAAQDLLNRAALTKAQLAALYGDATKAGSPVVPIQKSAAQLAVEANITALGTSFSQYTIGNIDGTRMPVGALLIYGSGGLQTISSDTAFKLAYDSLAGGGRAGMGDVDLVATLLLHDSFGGNQAARLAPTKRAFRTAVSGGWRFGTATGGRSHSPFDVPTGDGANALLVRSTTDVIFGRRVWLSSTVRAVKPFADNVVARIPGISDTTLFHSAYVGPAERALGSRLEIEIAPRLALGSFFGASFAYDLVHQGTSTYTATAIPATDPATLPLPVFETAATTVHQLQMGVSFSTLASYVRGNSRFPVDVLYNHALILTASGGVVPAPVSDQLQFRIYTRFPRR